MAGVDVKKLPDALKSDGDLPIDDFRNTIMDAGQDEPGWDQLFAEEFQSREDNKGYQIGARLIRYISADLERWKSLMLLTGGTYGRNKVDGKLRDTPAAIPGSKPDTVIIFPNVPISDWSERFDDCCAFLGWTILTKLADTWKKDVKDDKKKIKWSTTARTIKYIGKVEEVSIARYLTKYHNQGNESDHKIRDMAAAIEDARKPLTLVFGDTPEAMHTMYKTGPSSCMTYTGGNRDWGWLVKEHDIHLAAWYAYNPNTRGVFTMRKDTVAARTVIWREPDGTWKYGRIFAQNNTIKERFTQALRDKGYTPLNGYSYTSTAFDIPGTPRKPGKDNKEWVAPIPYFDNNGVRYKITFDKTTHAFHFEGAKDLKQGNLPSQGIVSSLMCDAPECRRCGKPVMQARYMVANSKDMYCGANCAGESGYVLAYMHDQDRRLVKRSLAIMDGLSGDHYYISMPVAITLGGAPMIKGHAVNRATYVLSVPEDHDYDADNPHISCYGYSLKIGKQYFRISGHTMEHLQQRNMVHKTSKKEPIAHLNGGGRHLGTV